MNNASLCGNTEIVKYLVEKGANIETENEDGNTPLFIACEKNNNDIVKYLIEKGANI